MAELRWEVIFHTTSTDAYNAAQEFRNETSRILHIRRIRQAVACQVMAPGEITEVELSKAPVIQMNTDESPFFTVPVRLVGPVTGATPADGGRDFNGESLYGRGHLTLEPNESLFLNGSQSADLTTTSTHVLGYEF